MTRREAEALAKAHPTAHIAWFRHCLGASVSASHAVTIEGANNFRTFPIVVRDIDDQRCGVGSVRRDELTPLNASTRALLDAVTP